MTSPTKLLIVERSINTTSRQRWQVEVPADHDVREWQESDTQGFEQYLLEHGLLLLEEIRDPMPVESDLQVLSVEDLESTSPARTFAIRLRQERRRAGLSQVELARAVSQRLGRRVDGSTLTRIEKEERSVRIEEALALARVLDQPLDYLLGEHGPPSTTSPNINSTPAH